MAQHDTPEQLLDVFKAAALSVTKLYKTSAQAEARARVDGYQDCIEDLLSFLDKEDIGLCDGEGWRIRRWATERLNGRATLPEGEDEADKRERTASPEITRQQPEPPSDAATPLEPSSPSTPQEPYSFTVPSSDSFTFESSHQYPNIATLDLSDTRTHDPTQLAARTARKALFTNTGNRQRLGRGAGTKRRVDFDDLFGGCFSKDPFPGNGKRSRHT